VALHTSDASLKPYIEDFKRNIPINVWKRAAIIKIVQVIFA
jgi:hypothetical protein